ncbi:response regulator transcription factor [Candidimonas nitroreducens]|uniref:DNA-binding response regulator n=1 Tax=Candidimonas nitroreducens TaxID=683354 RepID=A0A225M6V8_9BURK|nr:response regulator transcription factor [Candidimonas nitroreducens]OWT56856.1 DNA-binding response regulator [Candidimonas nitroreducens]
MRVLLVEDDPMIGEAVQDALKAAGYAVDWVKDGCAADTAARTLRYDLILLDLGLPGKDGHDVLHAIRAHDDPVPVLILTARDALSERLLGLDSGADDYVLKPFQMEELLARMRAVLRRKEGRSAPILSNGVVTLDPATHIATTPQRQPVRLTAREFALLRALLARPGAILSRSKLEDHIYGWGEEVESNAIEYIIHSLRKKLGNNVIENVRGLGWMVSKSG